MAYSTTYVRATSPPSGGPTPGAKALMAAIIARFPPATNLGIYNPRDVCGNPWPNFKCSPSQHATGRACDFGIPVASRPTLGDRIAQHLVTHCTALGITEVIWHRRRWTKTGGWVGYSGRSPHLDHVHTTLHPDAAARLTRAEVDATFTTTPTPKVTPMFDPPHVLQPIVAAREAPEGGVVLLGQDGSVYNYGGAAWFKGANGEPWFVGRRAARLDYIGDPAEPGAPERWRITATSGETYKLPIAG